MLVRRVSSFYTVGIRYYCEKVPTVSPYPIPIVKITVMQDGPKPALHFPGSNESSATAAATLFQGGRPLISLYSCRAIVFSADGSGLAVERSLSSFLSLN